MRKTIAVLIAPMLLVGCNILFSDHPWFSDADSAGASPLRNGLWAVMDRPDCQFDENLPASQWPECADAMVVDGNRLLSMNWTTDDSGGNRRIASTDVGEVVLAAGNPRVLQFHALGKEGDESKPDKLWAYVGVRPTAQDTSGRITAFNRWIVMCGPPAPPGGPDITRRPFRGITIQGSDCTATSQSALRNAAARSERLPGKNGKPETPPAHWVREGRV